MADATSPQQIQIKELTPNDYQLLRNAKTPEALRTAIDIIQMERGRVSGATFSPDTRKFLEKLFAPQGSQQAISQASDALSPFGDAISVFGAAALATATMDTSGSNEVIAHVNNRQLDTLFGDNSVYNDAAENGIVYEEQLDNLSSDALFHSQYQALEDRLRKAGLNETEIGDIRREYETRLRERSAQRADPKNSKRQQELDERERKRRERLRKELSNVGKEEEKKGKPLTKDQKRQKRMALLRQYTLEQQAKNGKDLDTLLSKRRMLGLGRKSTLRKPVKKVLLKSVRKEREDIWKEQERQRKAARLKKLPGKTPPEGWEESATTPINPSIPSQAAPTQTPQSPPQSNAPSGLGLPGIPGGIAKKAITSNPAFWGGVGGAIAAFLLLLMIIVFIVILFKLFGSSSPGPLKLIQLNCGNQIPTDKVDNTTDISTWMDKSAFHIKLDFSAYNNDRNPTAIAIAQNIYNAVCILYGETQAIDGKDYQMNTFGKLLVENWGSDSGLSKVPLGKIITITVVPSQKGLADCNIITLPNTKPEDPNGRSIDWLFVAPDTCLSVYQLQFRVAHTLALSLLYQQEYLYQQLATQDPQKYDYPHNLVDTIAQVFPDFPNLTILNGKPNLLPTTSCTKAAETQDLLPQCFADMVGEYLTYPYYLDGATTGLVHGAFIAGTIHDIDVAATAGMTYIINYDAYGGKGVLDMSTPEAKEMAKYNIKDVLDVWNFDYPKGCNTTSDDVVNFVKQYYQSPNLGGYWIKDDPSCGGAHFKMVRDAIRSVDSNTSHLIMAGFWDICALKDNYIAGMTDVAAFYPYHGYGMCDRKSAEDEIPEMAQFMSKQTSPVPFVGIYQSFWSDSATDGYHKVSTPAESDILNDVKIFMSKGASGVVAFSIGHPGDVNKGAGNDPSMLNLINAVRDQLGLSPLQPQ